MDHRCKSEFLLDAGTGRSTQWRMLLSMDAVSILPDPEVEKQLAPLPKLYYEPVHEVARYQPAAMRVS